MKTATKQSALCMLCLELVMFILLGWPGSARHIYCGYFVARSERYALSLLSCVSD